MTNHWSKLNNRQKISKEERFNYLMNVIKELEDHIPEAAGIKVDFNEETGVLTISVAESDN